MSEQQEILRAKRLTLFLHKKRDIGLIDLSAKEINDYVEGVAVGTNGEWGVCVNPQLHNSLSQEVKLEIANLLKAED